MSIAQKLMIAVGLTAIISVICILLPVTAVKEMNGVRARLNSFEALQEEVALNQELQLQVANAGQAVAEASLTRDRSVIDRKAKPAFDRTAQILARLQEIKKDDVGYIKQTQQELPGMMKAGGRVYEAYGISAADGKRAMEEYGKISDRVIKDVAAAGSKSLQSGRSHLKTIEEVLSAQARGVSLGGGAAAVIGLVIIAFMLLVRRSIVREINKILDGVLILTQGDGDLTQELQVSGDAEIRRLAMGINALIVWLRSMIATLYQQGEHVAVKVCEMAKTTKETVVTATTQKEEAVAVAVAAEEMTSTLNGVAGNTHHAAGVASSVDQAANSGMNAVVKACQCMEGIKESVEVTRGTVERLTDSSVKIGEIAGLIEDIADQTNLLALNAAIEAARAGEHGRGFAVVADEVKNLSAKTAASTREITNIINAIRHESQQALTAMHEEYARVEDGVETAQAARGGLSRILDLAGESTDMINQIATASEEQSVVTSEITEKIQRISNMAQDVNSQMTVTDETLLNLSEVAEQIFSTVGCFSVGTYHDEKRAITRRFRDRVEEALEKAVEGGAITIDQLFSRNYLPIANTDPEKYTTAYDSLFERIISPIQEEIFSANPDLATSTAFDDRGYLPCHLLKFSKPLTGNKEIDRVQNRSKLIFTDRTSVRACKNTAPFLLQTFMRVSGEIIIDLACPIFVRGRHWGNVRVGYSPRG